MKLATMLIIVAANQGYWFGGRQSTLVLRAAVRGGLPAADVAWELNFGGVRISAGKLAINPTGDTSISLAPPRVRARIALHWSYRLLDRATGAKIDQGELIIHVFPDDLMAGANRRIGRSRLIVWDQPTALPQLLENAKVPFTRVASADRFQAVDADIVFVGQNAIGDGPFAQTPLAGLIKAGKSVMIFHQDGPATLMGYHLGTRDVPQELQWRADHPLLNHLQPDDLQSWLIDQASLAIVRLPANEPALEIGFYPREVAGRQPTPIDAVLVTKTCNSGRVVLCQLPLGDWETDPRSQIVLRNAIDYLLSPPQPTPRPSERPTNQPSLRQTVSRVPVLSGDQP